MRLKKLKILGFKSFADKMVLDFHEGITCIVGPNGCGKSNISDAFRWVLGETSARAIRGKKMEDVIFAGTTTRKQLNYAEVTLTLTDVEGLLPTDYEEIEVTRRYHRSGESEYFINKHQVRMKDVQSLFLDSGVGKNAFSIFEQGKIDQVIQYTPAERRHIFEEAAGILRFLQNKREAMRKLEKTDQNMARVMDVHREVEKQIVVLEQQAEEARLYKENKARYEMLDKAVYLAKWEMFDGKICESQGKSGEQQEAIQACDASIATLTSELHDAKLSLQEGEQVLRQRSEHVFQTRSEKEIKARERQTTEERLHEMSVKEKKWNVELEEIATKRADRKQRSEEIGERLHVLDKEVKEKEKALASQKERVDVLEQQVHQLRDQQHSAHQERLQYLQDESKTESELKQNSVRLENSQERLATVEQRVGTLNAHIDELSGHVAEKQTHVNEASTVVDQYKAKFDTVNERLEAIVEELERTEKECYAIQGELTESRARQKSLIRLREELEGFSSGSKQLLQEAAKAKSTLFGKVKGLYEYLSPEKGGEQALAMVMRPYAQTLVVETENDLETVIAFAKQKKLKDFSIVCLENLPQAEKAQVKAKGVQPLLDLVSDSPLARSFLQGAFLADDQQKALELVKGGSGSEVWIKDDEAFVDRRHVFFYAPQGENNAFMREAELKTLEKEIKSLEVRFASLDEKLASLQDEKRQLQNQRMEADKEIRKSEMKLVEANFGLQKMHGDLERVKQEQQQLDEERTALRYAIENLTQLITDLENAFQQAQKKAQGVHQHSATLAEELEAKSDLYRQERDDLQQKQAAYQQAAEELRKLQHDQHVIEVQELESEQQEKRLREEIAGSHELQEQFKERSTQFNTVLDEVERNLEQALEACQTLEQEVVARREEIEKIEAKIAKEREKLKKLEQTEHQLGILTAQTASAREALEADLLDRYQMEVDDLKKMDLVLDKPLNEAEKEVKSLRKQLEKEVTEINMTSIEEYEKHKERYGFLNQQIDDMGGSREELMEIIAKLDNESRTLFKDTFDQVRANFQKNFQILFNGGEADLEFTDDGDVLEAGIEITAKPPGKQMRSINLLSGGEKCLTAVALLFAIFEVKSAPFCILDEIDAPLDDTNVERFVNVVKQFIDKSQFIIITHNKRTMAIADRIFGVTMQERGVSKILSMEFEKEAVVEPALV